MEEDMQLKLSLLCHTEDVKRNRGADVCISITVFPGWNASPFVPVPPVEQRACVWMGRGMGRRMTTSPSKPDGRTGNQRSAKACTNVHLPLRLNLLGTSVTMVVPDELLWFFLPTWHRVPTGCECYGRDLQEPRRPSVGSLDCHFGGGYACVCKQSTFSSWNWIKWSSK